MECGNSGHQLVETVTIAPARYLKVELIRFNSDIGNMQLNTQHLLAERPDWQAVLKLYFDLLDEVKIERDSEESGPRWARRIPQIENIAPEVLTEIHGQLIAMDLLTFQLEDKDDGLMYRITREGRRALLAVEKLSNESESELAA
ncbi:hypothetical protein KOR42_29840 [Thalassoglobus neptunius]|uniref:Uncharacterized protein n=1 Tax=Thalassoglobus neptunius TaxID=1938619 RepID=A0A5C5WNT5_9PLAN|nr:hypothetical protein [Thalassoglobus neptunius]TWT52298.1 hypothetical protein KOR42_29840 [Thalassoglobus neptunius]